MDAINTQQPEPEEINASGVLYVNSIWKTIQGEGPLAGLPATFIRLAGCNLQCPACDTEYTSRDAWRMESLVADSRIRLASTIVLTGGEPFRQHIAPLCRSLLLQGKIVQIETNGTLFHFNAHLLYQPDSRPEGLHIVCSPKTGKIHSQLAPMITAYKYVVRAGEIDEEDGLPTKTLGYNRPPARPIAPHYTLRERKDTIYIQPLDELDEEKNKANVKAAVEVCLAFGYRLCLQVHKIVGLP